MEYRALPRPRRLLPDRTSVREFLLLSGALATLQWLLRFCVFTWLCLPLYPVMAFPLSLLPTALTDGALLPSLVLTMLNSAVWGIVIGLMIQVSMRGKTSTD